jgi:hypothetical protein
MRFKAGKHPKFKGPSHGRPKAVGAKLHMPHRMGVQSLASADPEAMMGGPALGSAAGPGAAMSAPMGGAGAPPDGDADDQGGG